MQFLLTKRPTLTMETITALYKNLGGEGLK